MWLVAVIGLKTSPRHVSMNCKKAPDENFVVKATTVRTYSRVSIVCYLRNFPSKKQACDVANGLFRPDVSKLFVRGSHKLLHNGLRAAHLT